MPIILNPGRDDSIVTSIGELGIFSSISMGDYGELREKVGGSVAKSSPSAFARAIIQFICYPIESLEDGKYKPNSPVLKDEDIERLSDNETEEIARRYVIKNEHLFKPLVSKTRTDEAGKTVHYSEYGDVQYPQEPDETYVQYLHRLSVAEEEKYKANILVGTNFSQHLGHNIFKTLDLGESLRRTLSVVPQFNAPDFAARSELMVMADIAKSAEEARLRPYRMLSEQLDRLVYTSVQAGEFLVEMNKTQTKIAEETKKSSDTSGRFSRINVRLNIGVLVIALIAFGWAIYTFISTPREQLATGPVIENHANKIVDILTKIENVNSQSQLEQQNHEKERIKLEKELIEEIRQLRKFNETEMSLVRQRLQNLEDSKTTLRGSKSRN